MTNSADGAVSRRRTLLFAGLVVGLSLALYARSLGYALVFDDVPLLKYMDRVADVKGFWGLITTDFRPSIDDSIGYYRPVALLSFYLDRTLGGGGPFLFHLTNVLLNAANALLVFLLARKIAGLDAAALAAGLVFAVAPTHVEAAAFVSCRTDLLATFFALAAALAWWRRTREDGGALSAATLGVTIFLAVLSKESALLLPFTLTAWELLFPVRRGSPGIPRRFASWAPWAALGVAAALALRLFVAHVPFGVGEFRPIFPDRTSLPDHPALYPGIWLHYAYVSIVGWPLSAFYTPGRVFPGVANGAAFAALLAFFFCVRAKWREQAALLVWFAAFLLPVAGLVPLRGSIVADRFLYLPSAAFAIAVGSLLGHFLEKGKTAAKLAVAVLAVGLAAHAALAEYRLPVWEEDFTLFRAMTKDEPAFHMGYTGVGEAYYKAGQYDTALPYLEKAVELDYMNYRALLYLSFIYRFRGRAADADRAAALANYYQEQEKSGAQGGTR